jgi:hypothetical protein
MVEILEILHALQRIGSAAHILVAKDRLEDKLKEDLWLTLSGGIRMYFGGLRRSLHRQCMSKADMKELEKIIQFLLSILGSLADSVALLCSATVRTPL